MFSTRAAAAVIACVLLIAGFFIGLPGATVQSHLLGFGQVQCGSALFGGSPSVYNLPLQAGARDGADLDAPTYSSLCDDAVSGRRTVSLVVMGLGALGLLFCGLTAAARPKQSVSA